MIFLLSGYFPLKTGNLLALPGGVRPADNGFID